VRPFTRWRLTTFEHIDRAIARRATTASSAARGLLALGIGAEAISHRVPNGRLTVVHRGVCAVGHGAQRPLTRTPLRRSPPSQAPS